MPRAEKNKTVDRPTIAYDDDGNPIMPAPPKKRGRPALPRDDDGRIVRDPYFELHAELKKVKCPPALREDGTPNPDHYRWLAKQVADRVVLAATGKADLPKNFNLVHAQQFLEKYAEANGVEAKHLHDSRSDGEKAMDAVGELLAETRSVFELADAEVRAVERAMDAIDSMALEEASAKMSEAHERALRFLREHPDDLKAWRSLLSRVMRLRDRARSSIPKGTRAVDSAVESVRTLRFMVYVGRSNIAESVEAGPAASVFKIGKHHVIMAMGVWEAQHGVVWYPDGPRKGEIKYAGAILVAPPGHGKSEYAAHWAAEEYCTNQHHQFIFGHAKEEKATDMLKYVRACFEPGHPQGRRRAALYPDITLKRKGNQGGEIHFDTGVKTKQASGVAYGIKAAISGSDASRILFDDCVDQKEVDQVTERDRTFARMNATWMARLRGNDTFHLTVTTLWHPDDANVRRIELARRGEIRLKVVIQACGGPDTSPPFKPLWPEMYGSDYLRQTYKAWRNPSLYSAAYMADPRSESARIIKAIKFYDPDSPMHDQFMRHPRRYISVDPAATNNEKNDRAGILLGAVGELRVISPDNRSIRKLTVLRILNATEIHVNPIELADKVGLFVTQCNRRIDGVMIETKTAFHAVADYLGAQWDVKTIRLDPGIKSKLQRLKACANLIDHSGAANGFEAIVEFPGKVDDMGVLGPDPKFQWFYDQVLKFGIVPDDHALDALTQMVNYLSDDLTPGNGWRTNQIPGRVRVLGPLEQEVFQSSERSAYAQDDDVRFFSGALA
ncbi:MAG: hypothetical protein IPK85_04060 [Gemmatimonadetes bacterium]|nr:hypothetical protein [Gemmatimonadota bacterium]